MMIRRQHGFLATVLDAEESQFQTISARLTGGSSKTLRRLRASAPRGEQTRTTDDDVPTTARFLVDGARSGRISVTDGIDTVDWRLLEDVEATSSFCAPWRTDEDD